MAQPCTVLIAPSDLLAGLKQRAREANTELLAFADTDALRALDAITRRRPRLVALERVFAATPRGAALINRIRADPTLAESEIRVVSHDTASTRPASSDQAPEPASLAIVTSAPVPSLDQRGTRRAPRFKMSTPVEIIVDGNAAVLVDVSIIGAQVVSASALRPNQRVRVALSDAIGTERFNAIVAWARFEIPAGTGPQYRAGLEFVDADTSAVDAFCRRHRR